MSPAITIRIDDAHNTPLKAPSQADSRSLSDHSETTTVTYAEEHQHIDVFE